MVNFMDICHPTKMDWSLVTLGSAVIVFIGVIIVNDCVHDVRVQLKITGHLYKHMDWSLE
jgi:hypothetical protein